MQTISTRLLEVNPPYIPVIGHLDSQKPQSIPTIVLSVYWLTSKKDCLR